MKRSLLVFSLTFGLFVSTTVKAAGDLDVADVEALAKDSSWDEILKGADKVKPAQRNAAWKDAVEKAATETTKVAKPSFPPHELVKKYPFLSKSSKYMTAAAGQEEKLFEECTRSNYESWKCTDLFVSFLELGGVSNEALVSAAKSISRNTNPSEGIRVFKLAINEKSRGLCSDKQLESSVISAFNQNGSTATGAKEIATKFCFKELNEAIRSAVSQDMNGYAAIHGCEVLVAKNSVEGLIGKHCKKLVAEKKK